MNKHVAKQHEVSPQVEERLERAAEQLQKPADQVLEDALVHYLDRVERRGQLYSELDRRYEDYQRTGLHLTNAEVKDWLLKRIRGESAALPKRTADQCRQSNGPTLRASIWKSSISSCIAIVPTLRSGQ